MSLPVSLALQPVSINGLKQVSEHPSVDPAVSR